MRKNAEIMIESLISLIVIMIAVSIIFIFPMNLVELTNEIRVKSDIYDLAYSLAEKFILLEATTVTNQSTTINEIDYVFSIESSKTSFFDSSTDYSTLTVYPDIDSLKDKLIVTLNFVPVSSK